MEEKRFNKRTQYDARRQIEWHLEEVQKKADEMGQRPVKITRLRNGRSIMRFPLFSTKYARNGRQQEGIQYSDSVNGVSFRITPNAEHGMPDQVDGNLIRLVVSKAREIHYSMGICPSSIHLKRFEILQELGLSSGGNDYQALHERLGRISGTLYEGNIFYKDKIFSGPLITFSWPNDNDPNGVITIDLNKQFKDYLDQEKSVLAIPDEIMKLQSPLEIRLRELIQVHLGKGKSSWSIGFVRLAELCQITSPPKVFKRTLKGLPIPYFIDFSGGRKLADQVVKFTVKERQPNSIVPIIDALAGER